MKGKLLLFFAALLLAIATAEIICRIKGSYLSYNERTGAGGYSSPFDDDKGWTHRYAPHEKRLLQRTEFTDSWTANEDGLKEKSIAERKEGKRLLILGDSFTEGVGAPPDSSYPRILESIFRSNNDSSMQVIDAGIGGSDVFFEYKLLKVLLPKYKPDVVLVTCNPSDVIEYLTRGGFERFQPGDKVKFRQAPWFEPLYARSLVVRLLVHDVFHYDFSFIRRDDYNSEVKQAVQAMCAAIDSFQLYCSLNQVPFGIVFHPFYPDIINPRQYEMANLVAHCRDRNISYTDELEYLKANGIDDTNWKSIYWPVDGHFKPKGYELLAVCAYRLLQKQGWLQ